MGIDGSEVPDLVGNVSAIADGFAGFGDFYFLANGDLHLAFQHVEVFHGSRRVGLGLEQTIGLCLKIIPLGKVNQVQGAGYGQAAETILAFKDGYCGFHLMLKEQRAAVGLQDLINAGVQGPGEAVNR